MTFVNDQDCRLGRYVDSHCHIDLYPTPATIVDKCERAGIYTIAVTNAPSLFANTDALTGSTKFVRAAVGLHPQLVRSHGHELASMWPLLNRTRYVGEVGLDYTAPDKEDHAKQRAAFAAIIERCSEVRGKVITIHSRRAARDVIAIAGHQFPGTLILHWFSGSFRELEDAVTAGFLFSVNSAMLSSKKGRDIVRRIPRDRVLTETDGPFVKDSAGPMEPPNVASVIATLAQLWATESCSATDVVRANFARCIGETPTGRFCQHSR